jgi:UDP-N-acetylmuramoyl-tripeptide--D-alanyl-D-alanine ligase
MTKKMKKLLQLKLKWLAKMILARYKPEIIGVTGSAGKTSATEAIFAVLSSRMRVRHNEKNYNNEIGVPLTIIGKRSPGKNPIGWLAILLYGLKLILIKDKKYPEVLILEMAVDRPGDMTYLNSIAKCRIGVVTLIGPMHLEYFGSIENIIKEKGALITNLTAGGWAILNHDDEEARSMKSLSKVKVLTYGFDEKADLKALNPAFTFEEGPGSAKLAGMSFKLSYDGSSVPVRVPRMIGYQAIYAALAGAAVGLIHGMNQVEIAFALQSLKSPKGRMNLINGIKNTSIIDDTYNASPKPTIAALDVLGKIPLANGARRFAVLGDMLELGSYTEQGHCEVGQAAVKNGIDILITVGERSLGIAECAKKNGMAPENVFNFGNADAARLFVQERIKQGDLILVKGSQGMRMEKIVKEIMAEPLRAAELLVRQDWEDAE